LAVLEKQKRIDAELKKLTNLYADLPSNKKELLAPLIQNASFMKATLEDLQEIINEEGSTDQYQNGANQFGRKPSANLQAYNTLIKNYANTIDKLEKMLPAEVREKSRLETLIDES
jgi:hypothetical protein